MTHSRKYFSHALYLFVIFIFFASMLCSKVAADTHGSMGVQASQEYDSNSSRISGGSTSGDFLLRLVLRGQFLIQSAGHFFWARLREGGKVFYHDTSEDQIVSSLQSGYHFDLGKHKSIGISIDAKDMTQYRHTRDYLLLSASGFFSFDLWPSLSMTLQAGAKHFTFKPDPVIISQDKSIRFTNTGPFAQLKFTARLGKSWNAYAFYTLGVRFFDDLAYKLVPADSTVTSCIDENGCLIPTEVKRQDYNHALGFGLKLSTSWLQNKALMAKLTYVATINDSNSTGSTAIWHRLSGVLSIGLPWNLALHLMGTVQLTDYPDGRNLLFDLYEPDADENETSGVFRFTWRFFQEFQLVLEGAIYRGAIPLGEVGNAFFSRQTLLLGLAWNRD